MPNVLASDWLALHQSQASHWSRNVGAESARLSCVPRSLAAFARVAPHIAGGEVLLIGAEVSRDSVISVISSGKPDNASA